MLWPSPKSGSCGRALSPSERTTIHDDDAAVRSNPWLLECHPSVITEPDIKDPGGATVELVLKASVKREWRKAFWYRIGGGSCTFSQFPFRYRSIVWHVPHFHDNILSRALCTCYVERIETLSWINIRCDLRCDWQLKKTNCTAALFQSCPIFLFVLHMIYYLNALPNFVVLKQFPLYLSGTVVVCVWP